MALLAVLFIFSLQPAVAFGQATTSDTTATSSEEVASSTGITPDYISVPALDLFTSVESVGLTDEETMATPYNPKNVAWYSYGYAPGEKGRAALAAHLDWEGQRGPFWELSSVPVGSLIAVVGESGRTLVFSVASNRSYDQAASISNQVFGYSDTPRLSLITCEGTFLEAADVYSERQVVDATLVFDTANAENTSSLSLQ